MVSWLPPCGYLKLENITKFHGSNHKFKFWGFIWLGLELSCRALAGLCYSLLKKICFFCSLGLGGAEFIWIMKRGLISKE
jgi:hypothetical protein